MAYEEVVEHLVAAGQNITAAALAAHAAETDVPERDARLGMILFKMSIDLAKAVQYFRDADADTNAEDNFLVKGN